MLKKSLSLILLFFLICFFPAHARETVTISGFVMDMNSRAIELVKVSDHRSQLSTTTDIHGFYSLTLPKTDTVILSYSCLSYQTATRIIPIELQNPRVNVTLSISSRTLKEVTVKGQQRQTSTLQTLDVSNIRMLPDASGGSIEALLVTFAGVSSNNELSSQYSVRGGNYDENLVYVNGTEVYRPLLIRAGQQEGLSFINPEMVKEVKFSSGGFDAKYGDKMSSVLDIEYKQPKSFEAVASGSLLGANLYLGQASKNGKFTQIHGFRYKTNAYLLGTLDTKGTYKPSFTDYQTYMTWKLTPTTELSFLGNYSRNSYQFAPDSSSTAFGTFQQKYNLNIYFDGQEKDLFETSFGSLKLKKRLSDAVQLNLQSSVFRTDEDENYDITGQYYLSSTPIKNNQEDKDNETLIGVGTYHEHARNHLEASVFNITHYGEWKLDGHTGQWGVGYQKEIIHDKLREWEMRDSAGYALPYSDSQIKLVYNMRSKVDMISNRLTGYLQDTWRFRKSPGLFVVTGGVRGNYWDYNQETLISPRASIAFMPAWKKDFTFRLASGFYYQTPFYKELRDTATINGVTQIVLNQHIKAQKTIHYVAGMDYHFIWVDRPFKLTTELYYKDMSNLIPYTVDNVRIRYYGRNMADGYTAGLDMKLFGEFVPGTDSWISLSLMKSQETIDGVTVPRPNEQRYNVSVFFQDYFPSDPRFTMNLKLIWADGLPFGPPNEGRSFATLRMPPYRRIDIGLSRVFSPDQDIFMRKGALKWVKNLWIGVDCFNLLSTNNVNSYYWVTDIDNRQWAVPNYLTGRLLNFRFTVEF